MPFKLYNLKLLFLKIKDTFIILIMSNTNLTDIIQWDVVTWSEAIEFWDKHVDWSKINHCLELGGRQGGLSLWLALKGKQVVCSDLENVMNTAQPLHNKYKIKDKITYQNIDATAIPYEQHFDIIIFKSIIGGIAKIGGIDMQKKVFKEIYKALKPEGMLLFAENLVASPMHQFARKKFNKWGDYWRYLTIDETRSFLSNYKKLSYDTCGFSAAFGRNEKQRNVLAKIDQSLLNYLTPASYKYVIYGVAKK